MPVVTAPRHLADELIARGQHFATASEIASLLEIPVDAVRSSLRRATNAGAMLSITKGAWIPVPPEYRSWGAPPPAHYIDPLMRFLAHPYYVGFLSAAQMHGASHQAPMVFQIVTPAVMRDRRVGRSSLQFIRREATASRAVTTLTTPTGRIKVSTPEVTLLDLVDAPSLAGGLSNVTNIAAELVTNQKVNGTVLADAASSFPVAVVQRAGHLLEQAAAHVEVEIDLDALERLVAFRETVALDPRGRTVGERDRRWKLLVNVDVEFDT